MDATAGRETFPTALEAVFLVIGLYMAEFVLGALLFDLRGLSGADPRDLWGTIALLGNAVLFSAVLHYKRMSYASLFHPSPNSVTATLGTLAVPILLVVPGLGIAMWAASAVVVWLFPMSPWQEIMFDQMLSNGAASFIAVCLLAPVLEEMLFRGIILRSFLQQYRRPHAILGSAVIFGAAHLNVYQFAVGVMMGILVGWLYERARSLWPCILLHGAYNAAVTWIYYEEVEGGPGAMWEPSMLLVAAALLLAIPGAALLRRLLSPPAPA